MEATGLRLATADDVAAIAQLTDQAYDKYVPRIGRKPQPMTTSYAEYITHSPIWLLEVASQLVGVLALKHEADALLIYSVAIDPSQQRKGYGQFLLKWAEREAQQAGYQTICLYTNQHMHENIALYTKMGYQETGREPFGSSVRINMSKELLPE